MRPRDWAALVGLGLIWGTSYLFIKVAVRDFSPATLVTVRLGLAGLLLAGVAGFQRRPFPRSLRTWAKLLFLGAASGGVPISLIAWGERTISSGAASILNATTPLWSVLFTAWTREEPLRPWRLAGVAMGFAGVVVLTDPAQAARADLLGSGAVVLASALYAWGILYARRNFAHLDPVVLAAGSLGGGAVALFPMAVWSGLPASPTREAVASLLALSVFGSAVAYLLFYHLVLHVSPTQTALVTYLNPVTAVFWGRLILGESVTASTMAGLALTVAGVAAVGRGVPESPRGVGRRKGTIY